MIKICVAGATGRMGSILIQEAVKRGFEIVGALAAPEEPTIGKTLQELGICNLDVKVQSPANLEDAVRNADVYISFTSPKAELANIPMVADIGKRIVMGTTGFTEQEYERLKEYTAKRVPAVFAPNFSIGVNFTLKMLKSLKMLPQEYEISIFEAHHSGKKDAPSGTARSIAKLISELRSYTQTVYGREGISPRKPEELEVVSVRAGGIPGIHRIIIAGPYDMIIIEHTAFSRNVFAQGALHAAQWLMSQDKPGVYSMEEVLEQS
ncbi:4-hydroxy-tetrahydrodipicolinate reductase [Candidatus Bathyarchaeota archaeon]|nr:4-hydroxy-tetrahydrodipicolinate reductase [Candidatus Bathyarchaeota archaeon]